MLIILIIAIVMVAIPLIKTDYPEDNPSTWIGSILFIPCIISIIICISLVVGERTINQKIEMYQEENTNIETSISDTVKNYMQYEKDITINATESIKDTNILLLTQLYPDLKSSELINKQLEIYVSNNDKIKSLKEEKINIDIYKWWLYFGETQEE